MSGKPEGNKPYKKTKFTPPVDVVMVTRAKPTIDLTVNNQSNGEDAEKITQYSSDADDVFPMEVSRVIHKYPTNLPDRIIKRQPVPPKRCFMTTGRASSSAIEFSWKGSQANCNSVTNFDNVCIPWCVSIL